MAIVKGSTYFNIVFFKDSAIYSTVFFFMWLQQHLNRISLNRRFRKSFATGFLAGQQPVFADALIQGLEANLRPGRAMSRDVARGGWGPMIRLIRVESLKVGRWFFKKDFCSKLGQTSGSLEGFLEVNIWLFRTLGILSRWKVWAGADSTTCDNLPGTRMPLVQEVVWTTTESYQKSRSEAICCSRSSGKWFYGPVPGLQTPESSDPEVQFSCTMLHHSGQWPPHRVRPLLGALGGSRS